MPSFRFLKKQKRNKIMKKKNLAVNFLKAIISLAVILVAMHALYAKPTEPVKYKFEKETGGKIENERVILPCGLVRLKNGQAPVSNNTSEGWSYTQSLDGPRAEHALIPLKDGNILMVGGYSRDPDAPDGTNPNFHPEQGKIYNPLLQTWNNGPSLNTGRSGFVGLLLQNGKAALVGGSDLTGHHPNIEIFDPETGEFFLSADMQVERLGHDAIELNDGRILVVGGTDGWGTFFNSSEIYDPETNTWEMVESTFSLPRSIGQLAKLNDGRVMYMGGSNNWISRNNVDVFDPATGQWSSLTPMNKNRQQFSVEKLNDGRIMVVGGLSIQAHETFSSVEIFDPNENIWTFGSGMNHPRSNASTLLLPDGDLLIAGGQLLNSVEHFCSQSNQWRLRHEMNQKRSWFGLTLMENGELLAVGGTYGWDEVWETAEVYRLYFGNLEADHLTLDFGNVEQGELTEMDIRLKNNGHAWVELVDHSFSRPAFFLSEDLPALIFSKEESNITISFTGNLDSGFFEETLTLVINQGDGEENMELTLTGTIVVPTSVVPADACKPIVSVFPNPTKGELTIRSESKLLNMFIADITGRVVFEKAGINTNEAVIDLGRFGHGVYFINTTNKYGLFVEKVILSGD